MVIWWREVVTHKPILVVGLGQNMCSEWAILVKWSWLPWVYKLIASILTILTNKKKPLVKNQSHVILLHLLNFQISFYILNFGFPSPNPSPHETSRWFSSTVSIPSSQNITTSCMWSRWRWGVGVWREEAVWQCTSGAWSQLSRPIPEDPVEGAWKNNWTDQKALRSC